VYSFSTLTAVPELIYTININQYQISRTVHIPEPYNQEDLFIKEVDRECALNDIVMNPSLVSDLERTEGDAGEAVGEAPFFSL